jgi:hypothetical protein
MKKIRHYLIFCTLTLLILLYAFRREKVTTEKKASYSKLLTIAECISMSTDPENGNRSFTVKGIYKGREQKEGQSLIILQPENPGADSVKLYCIIRAEQNGACQLIKKGNELVVSGKLRPGKGQPVLQDVTIVSENITEEAVTY